MSYDKANSQKHFPVQVIAETFDLAREKLQRLWSLNDCSISPNSHPWGWRVNIYAWSIYILGFHMKIGNINFKMEPECWDNKAPLAVRCLILDWQKIQCEIGANHTKQTHVLLC